MKAINTILGVVIVTSLLFNCEKETIEPIQEESLEASLEKGFDVLSEEQINKYMETSRKYNVIDDQMARPAINTVFVSSGSKDLFNITPPSNQGDAFQAMFQDNLLALNPGYTTNALGLDATTFTTILATDVLNVSMVGTTTFFDGTNVLTGRTLSDDVISVELLLIFGGPDGSANPGLTDDHVDGNDKSFLTSFPYLASAH